ncbi:MAG: autoinducer binding domain-containing protein [Rhodobacteraceae bacterium]|jgi:LuxR family transcriptional regulator|nr:autoinducer binding domain-containing protein [Paracoccaceae bacterium]
MTLKHSQPLFRTLAPAGYYVALRVGFSFPDEEVNCLNQDWVDVYTQRGLFVHDPTMRWIYSNQGAIRWRDITLPDPAGVLALARQLDLGYGATISVSEGADRGRRSYGMLFRKDRELEDSELDQAFQALKRLHSRAQGGPSLTDAEAEAIRMRADGLLLKQIAAELAISESAVKARISSACRKLGARNAIELLAIASSRRLI